MGFASQQGQVGFKTQASQGVFADPGAVAPNNGVFALTRSGSLGPNRELLIPDAEIGGSRDVPDAYLGAVSWSGDYEFYARTKVVAILLKGVLGNVASVAAGAGATLVGTHTITPSANGLLPWLSIEDNIGGTLETFRYTDAKVNSFHLESDANGYLMGTAGLVARLQVAGATKTAAPAWDLNPMFVGTNVTVTYNGVTLPAKSFSFDITNNLEDDDFRLGSFYLGDVTEKRREVTAGVTIRPNDSALWRQAVYGASGVTAPQGQATAQQVVITALTYEVIGSTVERHSIAITLPNCIIEPFGLDQSGDDVIENDLTFRAVKKASANIVSVVVKNEVATVP